MNYQTAQFVASYGLSSQLPTCEKPEIVFSGRSNVGKSSLINKLCNRKSLARVSSTPGKTATINFYDVDGVSFVDLPGYGYARVSADERRRWNELIDRYFSLERSRALLLQLLDGRHDPSADDLQMLEYLRHNRIPYLVVLTKCDKLKKSELQAQTARMQQICAPYGCSGIIVTSAQTGTGIEELRARLEDSLQV